MLKRQFTEVDFIAYTGGAFGLFLGISIMSFVEVFYYFTIRLLFAYVRDKRKNRKVRGELIEVLDKTKSKLSYVKFYFSISTVHGMIQIIMDHRNFIERYVDGIASNCYQNCFKTFFRMFWTLCLVFSLLYCGITSYEMYEKLEQATVAITYDSDERSVENVGYFIVFHLKTLSKK